MKLPDYVHNDALRILVDRVPAYTKTDMGAIRRALGMTVTDFADVCGHSRSTQHRLEDTKDCDTEVSFQYQCMLHMLREMFGELLMGVKLTTDHN